MSVVRSKRHESSYLVVEQASDLYEKVVNMCVKMPKRYKDYISKDLVNLARDVRSCIVQGNSIRLSQATLYSDFVFRHQKYIEAYAALNELGAIINITIQRPFGLRSYDPETKSTKGVTIKELEIVSDLISVEDGLIKGSIKADYNKMVEINPTWKEALKDPFVSVY